MVGGGWEINDAQIHSTRESFSKCNVATDTMKNRGIWYVGFFLMQYECCTNRAFCVSFCVFGMHLNSNLFIHLWIETRRRSCCLIHSFFFCDFVNWIHYTLPIPSNAKQNKWLRAHYFGGRATMDTLHVLFEKRISGWMN